MHRHAIERRGRGHRLFAVRDDHKSRSAQEVFENVDDPHSYHGYGIQSYLNIDPRFGTKKVLVDLVDSSGQPVTPGSSSATTYNHYNVLRTIEDMYGTSHAGNAASASDITGIWAS